MARTKKTGGERSPKNKERQTGDVKTIGLRVSTAYADWLARAAAHERVRADFLGSRHLIDGLGLFARLVENDGHMSGAA